jgi:hypothetical protein
LFLPLWIAMTDTNPPQERATPDCDTKQDKKPVHHHGLLRPIGSSAIPNGMLREWGSSIDEERDAEALSRQTWDFLNNAEPDAGRRATLWLIAQGWIAADYDSELEGARRADNWIRAMCKPRSPPQP